MKSDDPLEQFIPENLQRHWGGFDPRARPSKRQAWLGALLLGVLVFSLATVNVEEASAFFGPVALIVLILLGLIVYFLPSLIAANRDHRNTAALFALNLLLGWTLLGWCAALVWSLYKEPGHR